MKLWTPMFFSMNHGGIRSGSLSGREVLSRMARAHGRTSSYVTSDIGAMEPGRWHAWHERWSIGATSRVNVTGGCEPVCAAASGAHGGAPASSTSPARTTAGSGSRRRFEMVCIAWTSSVRVLILAHLRQAGSRVPPRRIAGIDRH